MSPARTVAIVGAGFSGVATAVGLLRSGLKAPLRVVMVNRSGIMARGVAYGTRSPSHLLNVPVGRMSAFADDPDNFLRFARLRDGTITAASYMPRQLYGEYLDHLISTAAATTPVGRLERVVGEVQAIVPSTERRAAQLNTTAGAFLADRVVLALGNYAPDDPPVEERSFYQTRHYVRDPWAKHALDAIDVRQPVLLIGTGLTMIDIALELRSRGVPRLYAVSRHGLLPQPHRPPGPAPTAEHRPPNIETAPATARSYLRAVRDQARALAAQGIDWRTLLDALRPLTPKLWQALNVTERKRFLRHVRPYWEVHRHRAAPAPAGAITEMLGCGTLIVGAGRIRGYQWDDKGVEVRVQRRGHSASDTLRVGAVVNCTGPSSDLRNLADPLIASLRTQGLIRPDELGLGIETDGNGALLDAQRTPSSVLYYVGPLLRARDWECTAVPELRVQAARLATLLAQSLATESPA